MSAATDLGPLLDEVVYPALFERLDQAFPEFGWTRRGDHWTATSWPSDFPCEVTHPRPDRLVVYRDRPYWIKVHGRTGVRFLDLVNGGTKPTGNDFVVAVHRLCELAAVPPPQHQITDADVTRVARQEARREALHAVTMRCVNLLWSERGARARGYLTSERGFTEDEIDDLRLGLFPAAGEMKNWLEAAGVDLDVAQEAGLLSPKLEGYVTFPWADATGQPLTLYGRWPGSTPPFGKAIALRGKGTKNSPLYFDRARRAGHRDLVGVEGLIDAALLQGRGVTNVVAYVGAQFTKGQVDTLVRSGITSVTICPDPDGGGADGATRSVESLEKHDITTYVTPTLPDGLDPDKFVLRHGLDRWRAHVDAAVPGIVYCTRHVLRETTPEDTPELRREAVNEVFELLDRVGADPLQADEALEVIHERTGYPLETLREQRQHHEHVHRSTTSKATTKHDTDSDDQAEAKLVLRSAASIKTERVRWLEEKRIPTGALVILVGEPGQGKSTKTMDWAAKVSRGDLPGDYAGTPSSVLIATAEDSLGQVAKPRLEAAGADLAKIHFIEVEQNGARGNLTLTPTAIEQLRQAVVEHEARLVVIDPLAAHLPGKLDSHRDAQVRRVLAPLASTAEETGAAIVAIMHLSKAQTTQVLNRVGGSIGFVGAARSVLLLGRDPEAPDGDTRILAHAKSNWGQKAPSERLRIESARVPTCDDDIETSRMVMLDPNVDISAEQVLEAMESSPKEKEEPSDKPPTKLDFAKCFIMSMVYSGPVRVPIIENNATVSGIKKSTLYLAKEALKEEQGLRSRRVGGLADEGWWVWKLPPQNGEDLSEDDGLSRHSVEGCVGGTTKNLNIAKITTPLTGTPTPPHRPPAPPEAGAGDFVDPVDEIEIAIPPTTSGHDQDDLPCTVCGGTTCPYCHPDGFDLEVA